MLRIGDLKVSLEEEEKQIIKGLSYLGCLKHLEQLNLSKTNILSLGKNLALLVRHLVQESRLNKLGLSGMGISKKMLAGILVASTLVQAKDKREIEIFVGLKELKDFFMPKLTQWNLIRRKEYTQAKLGWLGLFSAHERPEVQSGEYLYQEKCNWNVLWDVNRSRALSFISKEIQRLWPDGKQSAIAMAKFQKRKSSELRREQATKRLKSQSQETNRRFSFTPTSEGELTTNDETFRGDIASSTQGQGLFERTDIQMRLEGEFAAEVNQHEQNPDGLDQEDQLPDGHILSLPVEIRLRIAEYAHQSDYSVKLS